LTGAREFASGAGRMARTIVSLREQRGGVKHSRHDRGARSGEGPAVSSIPFVSGSDVARFIWGVTPVVPPPRKIYIERPDKGV